MSFVLYMIALVISVLLFGAIHTYAYTIVFFCVLLAGFLSLVRRIRRCPERHIYTVTVIRTPFDLIFVLLFFYFGFQLVPLPQAFLNVISPGAFELGSTQLPLLASPDSHGVADKWLPLAPYGYPVRQSMVRLVVYWFMAAGLVSVLNSQKRINQAIAVVLGVGCFDALYGLAQTFSGAEHIWWYPKTAYIGSVTGTYINYNHFAGLMEMGVLLAAGFALALSRHRTGQPDKKQQPKTQPGAMALKLFPREPLSQKRLLIVLAGVVLGIGLIFSRSRGGMMSLAVVLAGAMIILRCSRQYRKKVYILWMLVLLVFGYAGFIGLASPLKKFGYIESSFMERLRFSKTTLAMFRDYPLTGVGVGNFKHAYPRYQSAEDVHRIIHYAHNDWMQFLAEAGGIGFFLLVIGICLFFFKTGRLWRRRHDPYAVILYGTFLAIVVCLTIHSLADFNLHIPANCLVLSAISAIGYSALYLKKGQGGDRFLSRHMVLPLRFRGAIFLVVVTGLMVWAGTTAFRHFMGETYCHTVRNQTLNRDIGPESDEILTALKWDKANAAYWSKLADALCREPVTPNVSRTVGGGTRLSIQALENAARLNPFNSWYHVRLARAYVDAWKQAGHYGPWLSQARISIQNATATAGTDPYLYCEIGDFWVTVTKALSPEHPGVSPEWAMALKHYQQALDYELRYRRGRLLRKIETFVHACFPGTRIPEELF